MSSLYNFKFSNYTKDEVIAKYEEVLYSRENQVTDLSMELGSVQAQLGKTEDLNETLNKELDRLNVLLKKKDYYLSEELKSKEWMFHQLQNKENECDELKLKVINNS